MPKLSFFLLFFIFFLTFFGEYFYTLSPYELDPHSILFSPSLQHPFGTDRLGRDILARVIEGGKVSLVIGIASALIASLIGLIYGVMAGYFRGYFDKIFVIVVDLFLTFPTLFLLLALVGYVDASVFILIAIISITGWMSTARLIRSDSYKITKQPFIKILNIAKVSKTKIFFKYYAPLLAPIFLVSFTFGIGGAILTESSLSFLGLGIVPPQMSWGTILNGGKEVIEIAWWVSFFPGLMIFLVTFCFMNIASYLQELFNQKEVQQ